MTERYTVRIDSGGASHLVVCNTCGYTAGPFVTREHAVAVRGNHARVHYLERAAERAVFARATQ